MEQNELTVNIYCLIVEKPRLVSTSASIFHERKKGSDLSPPQKKIFRCWLICFIGSNIKSKVEIILRGAMNNIFHCYFEAFYCIMLISYPASKHDIFRRVFGIGISSITINWSRHDQSLGIDKFCIIVKRSIVLICIFTKCYVPFVPVRVG